MDVIEEVGGPNSHEEKSAESGEENRDEKKSTSTIQTTNRNVQIENPKNFRLAKLAPLEVLNHVQFNNTLETPRSTIKGVLNVPAHRELTFNNENLKKVEGQLKQAFIEFYRKLRLLKNYR